MLTFVFDLLIGMLFLSGISMAAVGLYARRFTGRVPAATPFIILMFCAAAWSVLYALDLLTDSLPLRIFYHNLRFLFLPFIAVIELWLVLAYVKKSGWLRRDWAAMVLVIPVIAAILAITSPYHTLFRYNFSISTTGPVPVLQYAESPFYMLYFVYSFVLLALAILLLIIESRKQGTLREMPTILLLIALAFPTVLNYISQIFQIPFPGVNLTPAVLWIAAILYMVALFRYRFLDIIPIARSRLIESLSKPVLVLDTEERVIDLNPAASALFSLTPASALGRKIEELFPDWPDLLSLCRIGTSQKKDLVRVLGKGTRYYIGSGEPLLTRQGEVEGHLIFLQDITEMKNTEKALRESEERFRRLLAGSFDAVIIHQDGRIVLANESAARIIGAASSGDLVGRPVINLVHPDYREMVAGRILDMMRSPDGTVPLTEEKFLHFNGTAVTVEVMATATVHEGRPAIIVVFRDITREKQAEEALSESEAKYRTIIDEMQDLFYRTDMTGKITMLSPSAIRMAGYDSIDQLIGQDVTALYADSTEREKLLAALREKGAVFAYPISLKTRNGAILHVTTSSHFYSDARGNIQGVEGVIHDMTEQRKAEVALRMANKKLNLLSSITRHDIRNQLMALMAFLELSVEAMDNPAELAEYLKKNQKIAENIAGQITFTKDYEDLGVKAPSWQAVSAGMAKAADALPVRNIRIDVETAGLELFADPLIEKVFYNLIDNALRYGGEKMTAIHITSHAAGSKQVLVFEDDGAGIPDRDKMVIFNKGFGKNTGLGLYLSREILSITGITIAETGEPGKGARFEMTTPEGGFRFV